MIIRLTLDEKREVIKLQLRNEKKGLRSEVTEYMCLNISWILTLKFSVDCYRRYLNLNDVMRTHVRKNSIIALWNLVVQDVSGNGMHVFETRLHLSP